MQPVDCKYCEREIFFADVYQGFWIHNHTGRILCVGGETKATPTKKE